MSARLTKLRAELEKHQVPGALILDPTNVAYLSGFTGSTAWLLVLRDRAVFLTDGRYTVQAERECPGMELAIAEGSASYVEQLAKETARVGATHLAIEAEVVTLDRYDQLREKVAGVDFKPVSGLVAPLRRVKDAEEIATIRSACELADQTFDFLLTVLRPGISERDVATELEYFMKKNGAEKEAFDTIVASGARSALPHGRASDKLLEEGDFITFDFGAKVGPYHSDITRTVVLGKASDEQRRFYDLVLEGQLASLAAIRSGASGKAIDSVARDLFTARGYGDRFGHGLGHGLGRHVHDHPALSQKSDVTLETGMVVTVEPGLYIPGWGGVRIEDDVVVTETGCEILTQSPKELIEIAV